LAELGTIVRNTCRTPGAGPDWCAFEILSTPVGDKSKRDEAPSGAWTAGPLVRKRWCCGSVYLAHLFIACFQHPDFT